MISDYLSVLVLKVKLNKRKINKNMSTSTINKTKKNNVCCLRDIRSFSLIPLNMMQKYRWIAMLLFLYFNIWLPTINYSREFKLLEKFRFSRCLTKIFRSNFEWTPNVHCSLMCCQLLIERFFAQLQFYMPSGTKTDEKTMIR